MERRDFLKLASMTGLAVVAGSTVSNGGAKAAGESGYDGPLWLFLHAGGGWDVTSICDPKGSKGPTDPDPMNHYPASAIPKAGNIAYAPMELGDVNGMVYTASKTFFEKHQNDLVVVNGIDNATNSHDAGTRTTWAGSLLEGKPTVAALIAGAYLPAAPMSFITFGGYDTTDGVVGASRLGNLDALRKIAFPNKMNPNEQNEENIRYFNTPATNDRIIAARKARYDNLMKTQRLPRVQKSMSQLFTSRLGSNELTKLTEFLPNNQNIEDGIAGQAQLAIAAFKAGLCCSANLDRGGWDTHGNNDASVAQNLQGNNGSGFLPQISRIMELAAEQGVADNLVIMVGSDFGRTPGYNEGNGKDHWSVTSMMMMGSIKGVKIPGNRVIGTTDEGHNPITLNPSTLAPDPNGIRITPGHIQRAIRKAARISDNPIVANYPVEAAEDLPFFGEAG
jgi:uncharacterized protein (DUF1501 family)